MPTRAEAEAELRKWVEQLLSDYDVSRDAYQGDPDLGASMCALLDWLGIKEEART